MLFRTKITTLLQIFCEFVHRSKVICKSIKGPDRLVNKISKNEWIKGGPCFHSSDMFHTLGTLHDRMTGNNTKSCPDTRKI